MANLENVNNPKHYTHGGIEVIDIMETQLSPEEYRGYIKGQVIKYITREAYKNGDEDLAKAQWYLNRYMQYLDTHTAASVESTHTDTSVEIMHRWETTV